MIALYNRLIADGLTRHTAWRAAFAIVPVPILLSVSAFTLLFGTDHPAGKWKDRHSLPWTHGDHSRTPDPGPSGDLKSNEKDGENGTAEVSVSPADEKEKVVESAHGYETATTAVDKAVNEPLTLSSAMRVFSTPITWLPAVAYFTTFGYELAIDANLANVLFALYKKEHMGQTKAGYVGPGIIGTVINTDHANLHQIAGIYGLLNIFTRPLGGYFGDLAFRFFGVSQALLLANLACSLTHNAGPWEKVHYARLRCASRHTISGTRALY
jgi:MFS transporter, NNP family, nitrate/nitrite transporter